MSQLAVRPLFTPALGLTAAVLGSTAVLFAVAFDQGQLAQLVRLVAGDSVVHELFHDSRHVLGFACH